MSAVISPEKLYLDYRDKVARYIRSHVQNEHDWQDLTQQVFLTATAALDRYDLARGAAGTWLYVITRNVVADYYRARNREPVMVDLDEAAIPGVADERMLTQETLDALADALERLPERERNIVIWRFYHGLSARETAEKAGVSYANARFLQHQALKKLQKYLTE